MNDITENPLISDFIFAYTRADDATQDLDDAQNALFGYLPAYMKEIRKEARRMTQAQLADRLGVDHSYISKIENGHLKPSLEFVLKLFLFLDTWDKEPADGKPG